jgi:hypothetical protein
MDYLIELLPIANALRESKIKTKVIMLEVTEEEFNRINSSFPFTDFVIIENNEILKEHPERKMLCLNYAGFRFHFICFGTI